jgi:hypothetical protein
MCEREVLIKTPQTIMSSEMIGGLSSFFFFLSPASRWDVVGRVVVLGWGSKCRGEARGGLEPGFGDRTRPGL